VWRLELRQSPASASVGGGAPGLSQEAIDKIVNAASNEEERKLMAAVAATASADGTIGAKVCKKVATLSQGVLAESNRHDMVERHAHVWSRL